MRTGNDNKDSDEYRMYSQLVPRDLSKGSPPLIEMSTLRAMLRQHVDFRRLESIFQSFCGKEASTFARLSAMDIYFKVDELYYLGKVKSRQSWLPGVGMVQTFSFKLPHDGCLYTPDLDATLGPVKDSHYGTPGWFLLASSPCPVIDAWAQDCLGTPDIHPVYMYNFALNRLDIKFYNGWKQVSVTFEPGYPEMPFWEEWVEKTL